MANEQEKEAVARASMHFIKDGQVVGLGTGSTAAYFIQLLGERVKQGLRIRGIPSSDRSREQATNLGIPLTTFDQCQQIDITVDGADEVDDRLNLIKGGGGALLREKIVASATKQFIIVADATKRVRVLGKFPLPVEVIKFDGTLVSESIMHSDTNLVKTVEGRINQRNVWVRVEQVDPKVTSVKVQTRTPGGGTDIDLAHQVEKEIALKLVSTR